MTARVNLKGKRVQQRECNMKKCEDDYRKRKRERERKRMYLTNSVHRQCDRYDKYEEYGPAAAGPVTALRRRVFICANSLEGRSDPRMCEIVGFPYT